MNTQLGSGDHDRERRLETALHHLAYVEAPDGLRSRIAAAIDARRGATISAGGPNFSSAGMSVRLAARLALTMTLLILCVAGWRWLARPAPLPSTVLAGIDPDVTAPVLSSAAVPVPLSAAAPQRSGMRSAPAALPVPPAQSTRALTIDDDLSLPPLPDPPEKQFDDVAPAPLVLAQLDDPAPIEIEPLIFAGAPPDDDAGAGDSRW